jgi:cytochrome oxidase assembly protein ShyY1
VYRFAFRGRWLVGHLVVLAIAVLFVRLGFWQLSKHHRRQESNAVVEARRSLPPVPIQDLVRPSATDASADASAARYRMVTVTGRYDGAHQVIVPFRTSPDDQTGEYLLTPLLTPDGTGVIVNRGWIPFLESGRPPPARTGPPSGTITVTGFVLGSEPGAGRVALERTAGQPEINRIDLPTLARSVPYRLYPVYVELRSQRPAQAGSLPRPLPPAPTDAGPYLSYAIQWFLFTAIGLVGWPMIVRRAARGEDGAPSPGRPRAAALP